MSDSLGVGFPSNTVMGDPNFSYALGSSCKEIEIKVKAILIPDKWNSYMDYMFNAITRMTLSSNSSISGILMALIGVDEFSKHITPSKSDDVSSDDVKS